MFMSALLTRGRLAPILSLTALGLPAQLSADQAAPAPRTVALLERGQPVKVVCFGDSITGHKLLAETIARALSGNAVVLAEDRHSPPAPAATPPGGKRTSRAAPHG